MQISRIFYIQIPLLLTSWMTTAHSLHSVSLYWCILIKNSQLLNSIPLIFTWASQLPRWWRICLQCRKCGFDPWARKFPWNRKWLPTPVFFPGKSKGQGSLVGYRSWVWQRKITEVEYHSRHVLSGSPWSPGGGVGSLLCKLHFPLPFCIILSGRKFPWVVHT